MSPPDLRRRLFYRFFWLIAGLLAFFIFRMRAIGRSNVPQDGPLLLLGNHASAFDPVWAGFPIVRQAHFMASEALFRIPGLGWLISMLGAFPKQKFVRDHSSMKTLLRLYKGGQVIVMFPEGTRTWDGRTLPVRQGIGRLIKKMKARVVFARNRTGFLFQPRWARYPRFVPIVVEYSEPMTFEGMSELEIWAEVQKGISINPDEAEGVGVYFGLRMAHGLPAYLWACPDCLTLGGLEVNPRRGNFVRCTACEKSWRVTVSSHLRREGKEISIARAFDTIDEHFGLQPVADPEDDAANGVVLRCARGEILRLRKGQDSEPVAEGELRLTRTRVSLHDPAGEEVWGTELAALRAVTEEIGNKVRLLPPDDVLQILPEGQSPLMWSHFLRYWRHQARGDEGRPLPG